MSEYTKHGKQCNAATETRQLHACESVSSPKVATDSLTVNTLTFPQGNPLSTVTWTGFSAIPAAMPGPQVGYLSIDVGGTSYFIPLHQ
jgi:hypothetical protein